MSDKRKFLLENFATIQKARTRKPRPLSFDKIAKIISENGIQVSAQLVKAVCKERDSGKLKRELAAVGALNNAASDLIDHGPKLDGAATRMQRGTRKPSSRKTRPK